MPSLDFATKTLFEHFTHREPPRSAEAWYGPWTSLLSTLFPSSQGYIVGPRHQSPTNPTEAGRRPDFSLEVSKITFPFTLGPHYAAAPLQHPGAAALLIRTVLLVKVSDMPRWDSRVEGRSKLEQRVERYQLESQIDFHTRLAFQNAAGSRAVERVYWIAVAGPRWQYGERGADADQPRSLSEWHETTHDVQSFRDLQILAALVEEL